MAALARVWLLPRAKAASINDRRGRGLGHLQRPPFEVFPARREHAAACAELSKQFLETVC